MCLQVYACKRLRVGGDAQSILVQGCACVQELGVGHLTFKKPLVSERCQVFRTVA